MGRALQWWLTGAAVVALALLASVAVVIGVTANDAPTMLRVCDGDRIARYTPPAMCDSHELVWPRSRIPLRVGPTAPPVRDAIREVNGQVGFALLRAGEPADVTVTLGVPHEPHWRDTAATTWHDLSPMHADIRVSNVSDVATLHVVLVHELGHALGLAHSAAEDSVMHRAVTGAVRFTDAERAAMRRLYGVQ